MILQILNQPQLPLPENESDLIWYLLSLPIVRVPVIMLLLVFLVGFVMKHLTRLSESNIRYRVRRLTNNDDSRLYFIESKGTNDLLWQLLKDDNHKPISFIERNKALQKIQVLQEIESQKEDIDTTIVYET